MARIAYVDGSFMPMDQARVSVLDRGFLFGDGVYEVTAVLDGRLVDLDAHVDRLRRSLREIAVTLPAPIAGIAELQAELVRRNGLVEGLVYLQVTRGAGEERDFLAPAGAAPSLVMFTQARAVADLPAARTGIAVKTVADLRWVRRDIKSVGLLAQVLAKREAHEAGCQDAWMVEDGCVTEGASSTAFIITGDAIVTRENSRAILPGITRHAVLALAGEHGLRIEERAFTVAEAQTADEAFQTSATTFVLPIVRIDGVPIAGGVPGPLTRRLRALYLEFARGHVEIRQHAAE